MGQGRPAWRQVGLCSSPRPSRHLVNPHPRILTSNAVLRFVLKIIAHICCVHQIFVVSMPGNVVACCATCDLCGHTLAWWALRGGRPAQARQTVQALLADPDGRLADKVFRGQAVIAQAKYPPPRPPLSPRRGHKGHAWPFSA